MTALGRNLPKRRVMTRPRSAARQTEDSGQSRVSSDGEGFKVSPLGRLGSSQLRELYLNAISDLHISFQPVPSPAASPVAASVSLACVLNQTDAH